MSSDAAGDLRHGRSTKWSGSHVGTVERTHALPEGNDLPLDDVLIIAHVPVPPAVLIDFVNSGIPPRGYVFVSCSDNRKGSFLAAEDDLLLVCRSLDVGDVVTEGVVREGSMAGTVVEVADAYTVQPVWLQLPDGTVARAADIGTDHFRDCGSDLSRIVPMASSVTCPPANCATHRLCSKMISYATRTGLVR